MSTPATLPADFFDKKQATEASDTLPPDFFAKKTTPKPAPVKTLPSSEATVGSILPNFDLPKTVAEAFPDEASDKIGRSGLKFLGRVATTVAGLPISAVDEVTKGIGNALFTSKDPGDALSKMYVEPAKKLFVDPQVALYDEAGQLEQQANIAQAQGDQQGAENLRKAAMIKSRLSTMPFVGPIISDKAEQIGQGFDEGNFKKVRGAALDLGRDAVLTALGTQMSKNGGRPIEALPDALPKYLRKLPDGPIAAKARNAAVRGYLDAKLQAATETGIPFDQAAELKKVASEPTVDLIDATKAINDVTAEVRAGKKKLARPAPEEVATTDLVTEPVTNPVRAKVSEQNPAMPAADLKAAEAQASKVKQPVEQRSEIPADGSPAPAMLDAAEIAHLEQKGFTVDSQGRLARLVNESRPSRPEAGQAALESEVGPTPVFAPEPPPTPKGLLSPGSTEPVVMEPMTNQVIPDEPIVAEVAETSQIAKNNVTPETPTFTQGDQPGANYTSEQLKAFKEKNGIKDEPVQMVGKKSERGAVNPDLLTGLPAEYLAKATKDVAKATSEGRGVIAAGGNKNKEAPPAQPPNVKTAPPSGDLPKYAGSINLERLNTPDEVKRVILDSYQANKKTVDAVRKTGKTFAETEKAARELGWDDADVKNKKGAFNEDQITAAREVTIRANERVRSLQKTYAADPSVKNLIALQEALTDSASVNLAMQRASATAGRTLNIHKVFAKAARESQTNVQKAIRTIQDALGDKWEENAKVISDQLAKIPDDDTAALNRYIRKYAEFDAKDKVMAYYLANILSGVQTTSKNLAGNTTMIPLELATRAIEGSMDAASNKLFGTERKVYTREALESAKGRWAGRTQGFDAAMSILKDGMSAQQAAKLELPNHYEFQGWAKGWNYPGRILGAEDAIFKSMAISGELRALAYRAARSEGLKGKAANVRMAEILKNPSEQMLNAAMEQAKRETFTSDPGKWTKSYIQFRNAVAPVQVITPFVNVPINLMKRGIEYSPGGYLKLADPRVWRDGKARQAFARATIGTAISLWALDKYENGELTGKAPASQSERDQFNRTRQEYSVKVNGRWVRYTDFGPLMIPFMTVAAVQDARTSNKNFPADRVAMESIGALTRGIYDQSFYKSLSDMAGVVGAQGDFGGLVDRHLAGIASGFVPASGLLRSVKNVVDPTLRNPDNIYERIKAGLPWASETVPSRLNAFGEEQKNSRLQGILGFGLREAKVENTDIEKELARLSVSIPMTSDALTVTEQRPDGKLFGVQKQLTRDEQRDLTKIKGDARKTALRELFASDTYKEMTDEDKADAIEKAVKSADKDSKGTFTEGRKLTDKPKKSRLFSLGAQ